VPVVTFLRRFWLQNFRLNERDDYALYADDRVRWRAEIGGNPAARTMVASPYDLDVHNALSASPESITRSKSRSGTTTAAAGDRPQIVDPGPVSKRAVLGPRHIALAAEDQLQARDLVDAASIDAEGLVSTMAYHDGSLIGPMPGINQFEACTEGAFALKAFQLDRYR